MGWGLQALDADPALLVSGAQRLESGEVGERSLRNPRTVALDGALLSRDFPAPGEGGTVQQGPLAPQPHFSNPDVFFLKSHHKVTSHEIGSHLPVIYTRHPNFAEVEKT